MYARTLLVVALGICAAVLPSRFAQAGGSERGDPMPEPAVGDFIVIEQILDTVHVRITAVGTGRRAPTPVRVLRDGKVVQLRWKLMRGGYGIVEPCEGWTASPSAVQACDCSVAPGPHVYSFSWRGRARSVMPASEEALVLLPWQLRQQAAEEREEAEEKYRRAQEYSRSLPPKVRAREEEQCYDYLQPDWEDIAKRQHIDCAAACSTRGARQNVNAQHGPTRSKSGPSSAPHRQ